MTQTMEACNTITCFLKVSKIDHVRILKFNTLFNDVAQSENLFRNGHAGILLAHLAIVHQAHFGALLAGQCKRPFLALTIV